MPGARAGGSLGFMILAAVTSALGEGAAPDSTRDSTAVVAPPPPGAAQVPTPQQTAGPASQTAAPAQSTASPASPGPGATSATSPIPAVQVRVTVVEFGDIVIRLDTDKVPNAAAMFLTLVSTNAFDGVMFHRVIPGLLIQAGDPWTRDDDAANDGSTAPPWRLPAETTSRKQARGTVCLAWRGTDPASAGMQWLVTLADVPALDGKATPIGEVTEGMDVVDRIAQVSTFRNRRPLHPVRIQSTKLEPLGAHTAAAAATPAAGTPAAK